MKPSPMPQDQPTLPELRKLADEMNLYFTSGNNVPPNPSVSIPTVEWQALYAAIAASSPKGAALPEGMCNWHQDGDEGSTTFATDCGHYFQFNEGTPADNSAKFCQYCGGALVQVLIEPEQESA